MTARIRGGAATKDRMSIVEARIHFSRILNEVRYRGRRVIIEKHGKAKCAIVPIEDLRLLEAMWPVEIGKVKA